MKTKFTIDGLEVLKYCVLGGTPRLGDFIQINNMGYECIRVLWNIDDNTIYVKIKQID